MLSALLQNAHLKGFFTGKLYTGAAKQLCVPGINCYSCPGAVGSCPIGALQNSLSGLSFRFPCYVVGVLIFFGAVLGRIVCGFLCPLGFLQDLLYRIPFVKKIKTWRGDKPLRRLKYVILAVMVIILPVCIKLTPFFCKYLCPGGTLAGILLALSDHAIVSGLGLLFSWKVLMLAVIVVVSAFLRRPFCRYLCPLGAIYGPFNRIALVRLRVDADRCTSCKACKNVCELCVDPAVSPNSAECIRCGHCVDACPERAISFEIL